MFMYKHSSFVPISLVVASLIYYTATNNQVATALVLLSDIPTPSFVIDIDALPSQFNSKSPPLLYLPKFDTTLSPILISTGNKKSNEDNDEQKLPSPLLRYEFNDDKKDEEENGDSKSSSNNNLAVGYLHSSVIGAREDVVDENNNESTTFLAEVDLVQSLCFFPSSRRSKNLEDGKEEKEKRAVPKAHLVLGLNNHHVGSYYWARSAGVGASMEAPGIAFESLFSSSTSNNDEENDDCDNVERGIIKWETDGGPLECNSNDGKRSEWVNFLRIGDNVQFLPSCDEGAIMAFVQKFGDADESRIYGVSSKGRPLGSEPLVTCRWAVDS
jgi:hypothetical protein